MNRETLVIVYLSITLAACQFYWMKAEKKAAYLEGRASVFVDLAADSETGTCFVAAGCEEPFSKSKKHHVGGK